MKYCPLCKRRFDEPWLSFCSDDGTPLIQELTPSADPNWNPQIREPKVKTPDEEPTQWLPPRESARPRKRRRRRLKPPAEAPAQWLPPGGPRCRGGGCAPDERPPMSPGPWQP